ncbi:DUF6350 family protein [Trueperella sp. LYQ141]|uniref:cell division protein PerM n=1 Tax=Trueperella sp. LYQ141 TaxID=3391058 RepID=UPI003982FE1F
MRTIDLSRELAAVRAALAAPFFTWLAMVVVVLASYVVTASAPGLADSTWHDAARLATGWWMTSTGGQMKISGAPISVMPLSILAITCYTHYVRFRRCQMETWVEVVACGLGHAGVVAIIGLLIRPSGAWWLAIFISFFCAASVALASAPQLVPAEHIRHARTRIRATARVLAICSALLFILAALCGWSRIAHIHGYYLTGLVGSISLVILQMCYLPVAGIWALAWLFGAGFSVGTDTQFSIFGTTSAPLPAIPIFGALPPVGLRLGWLVIFVVLGAVVLGAWQTRKESQDGAVGLRQTLIRAVVCALVIAVSLGVLALFASGSLGPGRMSTVGPVPYHMVGWVLLLGGVPYILGSMAAHRQVIQRLRQRLAR